MVTDKEIVDFIEKAGSGIVDYYPTEQQWAVSFGGVRIAGYSSFREAMTVMAVLLS